MYHIGIKDTENIKKKKCKVKTKTLNINTH